MKKKVRVFPVVMVILAMLLAVPAYAEEYEAGAKTPPPPEEFQIQGIFDPDHDYLLDGSNFIAKHASGIIRMEGTTFAKQVVDTIGITFYLEKWNGSSWENLDSGSLYSTSNQEVFDYTAYRSAESGYYYRVKTIHWVLENGLYEQGGRISNHLLLSN